MTANWGIYLHITNDKGMFVYDGFQSRAEAERFWETELNADETMSVQPRQTKEEIARERALAESAITLTIEDLEAAMGSNYPRMEWENLYAEAKTNYDLTYEQILKELNDEA